MYISHINIYNIYIYVYSYHIVYSIYIYTINLYLNYRVVCPPNYHVRRCRDLRHLDSDLSSVMKAGEPDFDWNRVSFILEACWCKPTLLFAKKFQFSTTIIINIVSQPNCPRDSFWHAAMAL